MSESHLLPWALVGFLLAPALAALPAQAEDGADLTAKEIVDRMVEANRLGFEVGEADVQLITTDKEGNVREQEVHSQADVRDEARGLLDERRIRRDRIPAIHGLEDPVVPALERDVQVPAQKISSTSTFRR